MRKSIKIIALTLTVTLLLSLMAIGCGSKTATVSFDAGSGSFKNGTVISVNTDENGNVTFPTPPVKQDAAFDGWYNGDVRVNEKTSFKSNTTLTAKYSQNFASDMYDTLFDSETVVGVYINMKDAEWKKLNSDFITYEKSPIYRRADSVDFTLTTVDDTYTYSIKDVGVRMKGNFSRNEFYSNDGFYSNIHFKFDFGETFDGDEYGDDAMVWEDADARKERKDRTVFTLEKLDLKWNRNKDQNYIRDLYAMKLFRDNDILAPRATLCAISALNKDNSKINLGVYTLYEPVDSVFLERNLGEEEGSGDLYKCTYAKAPADLSQVTSIGIEDELKGEFYSYDKKTNKKAKDENGNLDFSAMSDFIRNINAANASVMAEYVDTEYFARFEAVNYIIGNPDCIRNNANNYYTYFLPSNGKAIIIPFDYDRCLGVTVDWDPTGNGCTTLTPYTRVNSGGNTQRNPLYSKLIGKGAPYDEGSVLMEYRQNLIDISEQFNVESFQTLYEVYRFNYSLFTASPLPNNTRFDDNRTGNLSFSAYINAKLKTLNANIDNYKA